jgi:hypothetical protein
LSQHVEIRAGHFGAALRAFGSEAVPKRQEDDIGTQSRVLQRCLEGRAKIREASEPLTSYHTGWLVHAPILAYGRVETTGSSGLYQIQSLLSSNG